MKMKKYDTVEEYIADTPLEIQSRLRHIRSIILSVKLGITESISYGMPGYAYKGKLTYFAAWNKHISLYAITHPVLQKFASQVKIYVKEKGTIQFPHAESLPLKLIEKLVKAQAELNEKSK